MLDTTKRPNTGYLREKANLLKSTARLYEEFAYLQADAENRQHFFMLQDAIACLADRAAEVCALAEILDGYASPSEYGFTEPENQTESRAQIIDEIKQTLRQLAKPVNQTGKES